MGLAFVDLVVLLMEGRGGRFEETSDGGLRVPAVRRRTAAVGRIAPRRSLPLQDFLAPCAAKPPGPPRFFTAEAVDALLAEHSELDFRTQLWPLIAKDAGYGYYRELFTGSPERVSMGWDRVLRAFAALDWYSPERAGWWPPPSRTGPCTWTLNSWTAPSPAASSPDDRRSRTPWPPTSCTTCGCATGPDHSETLALFLALLRVYMELGRLVRPERLNARSQQAVHGWWHGFFSFVDSGPPPHRLRQMLALHRAGLLQFLGPGLAVAADEATGLFVAASAQSGVTVRAAAFIEARLPAPSVARSANPLLRHLHRTGLGTEQQLLTRGRHAFHRTAAGLGPTTSWWARSANRSRRCSPWGPAPPAGVPAPLPGPAPTPRRSGKTMPWPGASCRPGRAPPLSRLPESAAITRRQPPPGKGLTMNQRTITGSGTPVRPRH